MHSALAFLFTAAALILVVVFAVLLGRAEKDCKAMGGVYHHPHCFERGAIINMK